MQPLWGSCNIMLEPLTFHHICNTYDICCEYNTAWTIRHMLWFTVSISAAVFPKEINFNMNGVFRRNDYPAYFTYKHPSMGISMMTSIAQGDLYIKHPAFPKAAVTVSFDWWEDPVLLKAEWRFASTTLMGRCVMITGTSWMLKWPAHSLTFPPQVRRSGVLVY